MRGPGVCDQQRPCLIRISLEIYMARPEILCRKCGVCSLTAIDGLYQPWIDENKPLPCSPEVSSTVQTRHEGQYSESRFRIVSFHNVRNICGYPLHRWIQVSSGRSAGLIRVGPGVDMASADAGMATDREIRRAGFRC